MANDKPYIVPSGWRLLLQDAGIDSSNVLRRASLPEDLLSRDRACLSRDEYFRLWQGVEDEGSDPALPLRIASSMSVEAFDPPVFAAFCSPNLNVALARLAKYKRLTCGKVLTVEVTDNATTIVDERLDKSAQPPATLVLTELVFVVQLGRIATRERICPLEVRSPILPGKANDFTEFFGVSVRRGDVPQVRFSSADASRPFLTANESMWTFFEKELNKRLADLTESATTRDKVHAVLLELLPAGVASMDAVAKQLGVSSRTLHRRLKEEHLTFQKVLDDTREALAMHYLKSSLMSGAEISFLLGYEDPNSFFRAFSGWTGTTPESARREMALVH